MIFGRLRVHTFRSPKFTSAGRSRHDVLNAAIGNLQDILVLGSEADYSWRTWMLTEVRHERS
jgi:hypothetical protein